MPHLLEFHGRGKFITPNHSLAIQTTGALPHAAALRRIAIMTDVALTIPRLQHDTMRVHSCPSPQTNPQDMSQQQQMIEVCFPAACASTALRNDHHDDRDDNVCTGRRARPETSPP